MNCRFVKRFHTVHDMLSGQENLNKILFLLKYLLCDLVLSRI